MTTWEEDQERAAPINAVQSEMLGFCTCGDPSASLRYVRDGLRLIDDGMKCPTPRPWGPSPETKEAFSAWFDEHKLRCKKHFGSDAAEYFFYYWADKGGYTEHGGSVPGWLTDSGKDLLDRLNRWSKLVDAEDLV